jgi:hypothetical protein
VEEDGERDENDSKPYLVTGSAALIGRPSKTETEGVKPNKRGLRPRGRDKGGLAICFRFTSLPRIDQLPNTGSIRSPVG